MGVTQKIKKGEVWLANLNPRKGTEAGKTRPVLILQDQVLLDVSHPSTVIIPLTTNLVDDGYPLRLRVESQNNLKKDSDLLIDQVRAIDNRRLVSGPLTALLENDLNKVYAALSEVIGDV